jgi:hypothetical protein
LQDLGGRARKTTPCREFSERKGKRVRRRRCFEVNERERGGSKRGDVNQEASHGLKGLSGGSAGCGCPLQLISDARSQLDFRPLNLSIDLNSSLLYHDYLNCLSFILILAISPTTLSINPTY